MSSILLIAEYLMHHILTSRFAVDAEPMIKPPTMIRCFQDITADNLNNCDTGLAIIMSRVFDSELLIKSFVSCKDQIEAIPIMDFVHGCEEIKKIVCEFPLRCSLR